MKKFIFILFFVLFAFSSALQAQVNIPEAGKPLPLIEGGAGIFHARFPHYPSAATSFSLTLPYPTFIYRGDVVRADENGGLRSRFFNTDNFEINLSIGGALPVSSEKIEVRDGMPDLKTMVEFGPGFIWHITPKKKKYRFRLSLNIPIRIAYSIDFKATDDRGWVFNPFLFGFGRLVGKTNMFYFASYRWANAEFQKTFFEVESKYATNNRPTYIAKEGTVLASAGLGFSHLFKNKYQLFTGISYDHFSLNPNRDSPLYQKNYSTTMIVGCTWWFYKSQKIVSVR
jgi:outer membrane protein